MLGETEAWGGWVLESKTPVSKKPGERLENRVPGFLRKNSKPNSKDVIYVFWASTGLHLEKSKVLNSFNSAWTIPEWKSLKSKAGSFTGRRRKKGQLVAFCVHNIIFFFSALPWSSVNWLWICFPELSGESLKRRTGCSFFMHLWQSRWVELCRFVLAQGCLAEEWLSRLWAPWDCHALRESTF